MWPSAGREVREPVVANAAGVAAIAGVMPLVRSSCLWGALMGAQGKHSDQCYWFLARCLPHLGNWNAADCRRSRQFAADEELVFVGNGQTSKPLQFTKTGTLPNVLPHLLTIP